MKYVKGKHKKMSSFRTFRPNLLETAHHLIFIFSKVTMSES